MSGFAHYTTKQPRKASALPVCVGQHDGSAHFNVVARQYISRFHQSETGSYDIIYKQRFYTCGSCIKKISWVLEPETLGSARIADTVLCMKLAVKRLAGCRFETTSQNCGMAVSTFRIVVDRNGHCARFDISFKGGETLFCENAIYRPAMRQMLGEQKRLDIIVGVKTYNLEAVIQSSCFRLGLQKFSSARLAKRQKRDRPADMTTHQSILSTAKKASCGNWTFPIDFIRFFPCFCFSRSFLFLVISPP